MAWSIEGVNGQLFLTNEKGEKLVNDKGNDYGCIIGVACGRSSAEIVFQLEGCKFRKHMLRALFKFSTEFTRRSSLEKCTTNLEFIKTLEEEGVSRLTSKRKTPETRAKNREWPASSGTVEAPYTDENQELTILKTKNAGKFTVAMERLSPGTKEYLIRPISEAWVHSIKDSIKMTPTSPVTRLPVLLDPIQVRNENNRLLSFEKKFLSPGKSRTAQPFHRTYLPEPIWTVYKLLLQNHRYSFGMDNYSSDILQAPADATETRQRLEHGEL
ncbi:uncharacterized protein LOC128548165 [Mercenaria mercenaria]|uniref:uncharacterized protein LOC128548165 n=1 Tax=Mercenaria mercenaria TaxID=6596 RepID=UPI00234EBA73|nr:uncharacterized protein LOC128548165 [Mercenaria mercenaria]